MTEPSPELAQAIKRTVRRIAGGHVVAIGVVIVDDRGATITTFGGQSDGHYWTLLAGAAQLLARIHKEG